MNYKEFHKQLGKLNSDLIVPSDLMLWPEVRADFVDGKFVMKYVEIDGGRLNSFVQINLKCIGVVEFYLSEKYQDYPQYAIRLADLCMAFAMTSVDDRFKSDSEGEND